MKTKKQKSYFFGLIAEYYVIFLFFFEGYKLLKHRYKTKFGEIDIIAKDKKEYVFIEVKTRTSSKYGMPSEAVDFNKEKHIKKSSQVYVYLNNLENKYIRYDVIEVYFINKNKYYINHLKNNFAKKLAIIYFYIYN